MAKVKVTDETKKVRDAAKRGAITTLGRAGAYIWGIAKKLIKSAPAGVYSKPGQSPFTHAKRVLRKAIRFGVDRPNQSVVIGPINNGLGHVAATLEFGGIEGPKPGRKPNFVLQVGGHGPMRTTGPGLKKGLAFGKLKTGAQVFRAKEIAASLPPAVRGGGAATTRHYKPRPYMSRSLEIGKAKLPLLWSNSIRSAA